MPGDMATGGSVLITSDGVTGTSGNPTRVFNIHIISGAGGGAVVSFRNGATVGSTIYLTEVGTVSTGKTIDYGTNGQYFPSGCFVDVDTNTTSVLVAYSQ